MKAERIKSWVDFFTSRGREGILPEQVEALIREAQAEQRERDAELLGGLKAKLPKSDSNFGQGWNAALKNAQETLRW